MHVETYIDEYLEGRLPPARRAEVEEHLASCRRCREHMEWLRALRSMAEQARIEHPPEIMETLQTRLLDLPERLERTGTAPSRTLVRGVWIRPLLQAAALLLLGVGLGWVVRGGTGSAGPGGTTLSDAPAMESAARMMAEREAALQDRVQELEAALVSTYLTRVETAFMHFVDDADAGRPSSGDPGTYQDLLSLTANLKADSRSRGEERLGRLYAQVESVLLEIERLSRERDLPGARHVADLIEEQGLLSALQRMKVGVE